MVRFVLGPEGSGKTKWLVDKANEEIKKDNGNIIFIDVDDNHIFSLDYSVRLINAIEFNIKNIESFYGFLCGIIGSDYDVEKVYVDGIYKVFPLEADDLKKLNEYLLTISEKFNTEFHIGSDLSIDDVPDELKGNCIELEVA
ncbi:hypothetical protein K8M07_04400 [Schnuerera sp. xch1]|uniref:hypothetical protein n=1 Tax=Schnuerera sp. xch1 TaxID=2874283 RepID=UPI001CC16E43|nr:hypothetical protein [Schnuerera sp. xch1]MBZ2174481.1 hypothetical protein [Schnuerera sp. xch1]